MKYAISVRPGQVFVEPDLLPICGILGNLAWNLEANKLTLKKVHIARDTEASARTGITYAPHVPTQQVRVEWPSPGELLIEVQKTSYSAVASRLGVLVESVKRKVRLNAQKRFTQ